MAGLQAKRKPIFLGTGILIVIAFVIYVVSAIDSADDSSRRTYSLEDLGVTDLVSAHVAESRVSWSEPRTREDADNVLDLAWTGFFELRGHERERAWFERGVAAVLTDAVEDLAGDLDWYRGILAEEWYRAVDACARASGYARGYGDFSDVPATIGGDWPEYDAVTLRDRDRCARQADLFPGLDVEVRDDLLRRTERQLEASLEAWIRSSPEVQVPVEWHPGAPQPFADSLTEYCRQSSNPTRCASDAGVELPVESGRVR